MDAFGVKELRSLVDTGLINLKPITILVGQNGSGKSTFLRTFPLLRQSAEARTIGPVLWYGRYVDFGSYQDALREDSKSREIGFQFHLRLDSGMTKRVPSVLLRRRFGILGRINVNVEIKICEDQKTKNTILSKCIIKFEDQVVLISISDGNRIEKLNINKEDYSYKDIERILIGTMNFMPSIFRYYRKREDASSTSRREAFARRPLISNVRKYVSGNLSEYKVNSLCNMLRLGSSNKMLEDMKKKTIGGKTWVNKVGPWRVGDKSFQKMRNLVVAYRLPDLLREIDQSITEFANRVHYIYPTRATAERYYRRQDLAIDEIDFRGQNLAMLMMGLSARERNQFAKWTEENFLFRPAARSRTGHISIVISKEDGKSEYNIADEGFGLSQVLPIIAQLWVLSSGKNLKVRAPAGRAIETRLLPHEASAIFAMEQPELHLHPQMQASLADAFIQAIHVARDNGVDLRLIIETHSESIVNRIGHRISDGVISKDSVGVVLFEKKAGGKDTNVRIAEYDDEGYLKNWPHGFFEPEYF